MLAAVFWVNVGHQCQVYLSPRFTCMHSAVPTQTSAMPTYTRNRCSIFPVLLCLLLNSRESLNSVITNVNALVQGVPQKSQCIGELQRAADEVARRCRSVDQAARDAAVAKFLARRQHALGFVSMLMDISSEMIHALLPVYMVTILGTSALTVGLIEGIAEATASITKVFSGALSDWLGKRKFLAAIGYGLAAFTKPIFPLAPTVGWLVAARFIDRIGKGIRGAPRDALVADIAPAHLRGAPRHAACVPVLLGCSC